MAQHAKLTEDIGKNFGLPPNLMLGVSCDIVEGGLEQALRQFHAT